MYYVVWDLIFQSNNIGFQIFCVDVVFHAYGLLIYTCFCFFLHRLSYSAILEAAILKLQMSLLIKWREGEIIPGDSSRGYVSKPLREIDCFTTGIVIHKRGNYLCSVLGMRISIQHPHRQLIYINSPGAVSLLLLPLLWPLSLYQLPTHACTPSPSCLLCSLIIPDPEIGGGDTTLSPSPKYKHTHPFWVVSQHSLMNLYATGGRCGPGRVLCVLTVSSHMWDRCVFVETLKHLLTSFIY